MLVWVSGQVNDQSSLSLGLKGGYDAGYIQWLKDGAGTGYIIRDLSYVEMQVLSRQTKQTKTPTTAINIQETSAVTPLTLEFDVAMLE